MDIKTQYWAGAEAVLDAVIKAGGGTLTVLDPQDADWLSMARAAQVSGLLATLRNLGDRLVLELRRPGTISAKPGRQPGPLNERLCSVRVGQSLLVPVSECAGPALRSLCSRLNRTSAQRGVILQVHAARGADDSHRVRGLAIPKSIYPDKVPPAKATEPDSTWDE